MDRLEEIRRCVKLIDETLIEMDKENQQLKDAIPKNNSAWLKWGREKDIKIERLKEVIDNIRIWGENGLKEANQMYSAKSCCEVIVVKVNEILKEQ